VIGDALWRADFGMRQDIVGQSILLDNKTYTIVGVAPKGFTGPTLTRVDVWMPESVLAPTRTNRWTTTWNSRWLSIIGRLSPGTSAEAAGARATAVFRGASRGPDASTAQAPLAAQPLLSDRDGREPMESRVSAWLLGVTAVVLLVS